MTNCAADFNPVELSSKPPQQPYGKQAKKAKFNVLSIDRAFQVLQFERGNPNKKT